MVLAAVSFNFNPSTAILGLSVRLETLALAGVVFLVLVLAALSSGRAARGPAGAGADEAPSLPKLRRDDLILIAFGAVPGAVLGARLGYVLIHFDYYATDPLAIVDPAKGGFELTMAVVMGTLSAIAVARLLAAPVARWLGVAGIPVLLGLGLGKLAMALGGVGQGAYSSASWATRYPGDGPWGSTNPGYAAIPSQLVEGGAVLAVTVLVLILPFMLRLRLIDWGRILRPDLAPRRSWPLLAGRNRYLTALSLWAVVRLIVASTWREARVLGPFVAEQLLIVAMTLAVFFGPAAVKKVRRLPHAVSAWRATRLAARAARAARAEKAARREEATWAALRSAKAERAARREEAARDTRRAARAEKAARREEAARDTRRAARAEKAARREEAARDTRRAARAEKAARREEAARAKEEGAGQGGRGGQS
jgi:prolipoprotein diacylglyceryltransferase